MGKFVAQGFFVSKRSSTEMNQTHSMWSGGLPVFSNAFGVWKKSSDQLSKSLSASARLFLSNPPVYFLIGKIGRSTN